MLATNAAKTPRAAVGRGTTSRPEARSIALILLFALGVVACGGGATREGGLPGAGPSQPGGSDSLAPFVDIRSPTDGSTTGSAAVTLTGVASDNVGVIEVRWRNQSNGASGTASGTSSWTATSVPLRSGANVLVATARDAAGNTRDDQITVHYSPASQNSALLSWDANIEPDLAGYRVYYGTTPGSYLQTKGQGIVVTGTSYTVAGLASGVRYYFAVTAFDHSSNESDYSQEVFKDIP